MTDDVTIRFVADVSDLQKGMQQATGAMETTTGALRNGATQINASFSSLSEAYAQNVKEKITIEETAGDALLESARRVQQAQYEIALDGVMQQSTLIKEQGQIGQISRQEELASLLALDGQREDIERRRLDAQKSAIQEGTTDFAAAQRDIEDLASQSAQKREEIERSVNDQIAADYRRSFERIGSSATSSVMAMIQGHQTLAQAAQRVTLSIIQSFVQARVKMVADWASGIAAQMTLTSSGEATKTAAVAAGSAARTGLETAASTASTTGAISSVLQSISASAAETFAGIFGFLSPVMGPAAAGPAAAGEAAVLSVAGGLASFAVGAWSLPSDMIAQVHQGEMIVPAGPAAALRSAMDGGNGIAGAVHVHHATNFNIQAIDAAGVKQFFKDHGKTILRSINESVRTGSHLGLSKLGSA